MPTSNAAVDAYIASFGDDVRHVLESLRRTICEVAPDAEETIRYDIPTFTLNGVSLVHLAGWKRHVSLYPVPSGDAAFAERAAPYRSGKGTLRFSPSEAVPLALVADVVALLRAERFGSQPVTRRGARPRARARRR